MFGRSALPPCDWWREKRIQREMGPCTSLQNAALRLNWLKSSSEQCTVVFFSVIVFVWQKLETLATRQPPPPKKKKHPRTPRILFYLPAKPTRLSAGLTPRCNKGHWVGRNPLQVCRRFCLIHTAWRGFTSDVSVPQSPAPAPHWWCTSAAASPPAPCCVPVGSSRALLPSADLKESERRQGGTMNIKERGSCSRSGNVSNVGEFYSDMIFLKRGL